MLVFLLCVRTEKPVKPLGMILLFLHLPNTLPCTVKLSLQCISREHFYLSYPPEALYPLNTHTHTELRTDQTFLPPLLTLKANSAPKEILFNNYNFSLFLNKSFRV